MCTRSCHAWVPPVPHLYLLSLPRKFPFVQEKAHHLEKVDHPEKEKAARPAKVDHLARAGHLQKADRRARARHLQKEKVDHRAKVRELTARLSVDTAFN